MEEKTYGEEQPLRLPATDSADNDQALLLGIVA